MTKNIFKILGVAVSVATIVNSVTTVMADIPDITNINISAKKSVISDAEYSDINEEKIIKYNSSDFTVNKKIKDEITAEELADITNSYCNITINSEGNEVHSIDFDKFEECIKSSEAFYNYIVDGTLNAWKSSYNKYGDALQPHAKEIYIGLVNNLNDIEKTNFNLTFNSGSYEKTQLDNALPFIAYSYFYDHPERYWINPNSLNYEILSKNTNGKITSIKVKLEKKSVYKSNNDERVRINQMNSEVNNIINNMDQERIKTDVDKIVYFNQWICKNTSYHSNEKSCYDLDATGIFVNKNAVCQGFAFAFKLLCDKENIPCLFVPGFYNNNGHAWNYVKLGGKWYFIDTSNNTKSKYTESSDYEYDYYYFLKKIPSTYETSFSTYCVATPTNVSGDYYINYGDVNLDGNIDASDASLALLYSINKNRKITYLGEVAADVAPKYGILNDKDDNDSNTILEYVRNNEYKFPIYSTLSNKK